jgi:hypothetical protein
MKVGSWSWTVKRQKRGWERREKNPATVVSSFFFYFYNVIHHTLSISFTVVCGRSRRSFFALLLLLFCSCPLHSLLLIININTHWAFSFYLFFYDSDNYLARHWIACHKVNMSYLSLSLSLSVSPPPFGSENDSGLPLKMTWNSSAWGLPWFAGRGRGRGESMFDLSGGSILIRSRTYVSLSPSLHVNSFMGKIRKWGVRTYIQSYPPTFSKLETKPPCRLSGTHTHTLSLSLSFSHTHPVPPPPSLSCFSVLEPYIFTQCTKLPRTLSLFIVILT